MKAKYIGKCKEKYSDAVHLFYEYRGREYMITDEHNGYSKTMAEKHREEQERIDKILEEATQPSKTRESYKVGLDMLFNYFETGNFE